MTAHEYVVTRYIEKYWEKKDKDTNKKKESLKNDSSSK